RACCALRRSPRGPGRRPRRSRGHLHADGAGGGGGDARLRAHRGRALGRVRGLRAARARQAHRRCVSGDGDLGVVRHRRAAGDPGGQSVALAWSMEAIYGMRPGDVFWAASDVGWVVGHSYIVYAPLLAGCTSILYEGKPVGTPDAGAFWRVVSQHRVNALFTAPTAFRAIKREDPGGALIGRYDLASLNTLFLAGER